MIELQLFLAFLKIGLFSFGGAYGAIPLIQETVLAHGWMDAEMFANMVAVSESTPGPIMVNMATYVGSEKAGFIGALLTTIGVVLPSFLILLLITAFFHTVVKRKGVQAAFAGIKPCIIGIIIAAGLQLFMELLWRQKDSFELDWFAIIILCCLLVLQFLYRRSRKKELSPILVIVAAAILGGVLYSV